MLYQPAMNAPDEQLVLPDLSCWIERYLNDCRLGMRKPATLIHYSNALKRFSIWYEEILTAEYISKRNAKDFGYWLACKKNKYDDHDGRPTEEKTLSPATVRRTIGVTRTFLRWLNAEGYLGRNFADWFPLPKVGNLPKRIIKPKTLQGLFDGAAAGEQSIRDTAVIALLADSGLRREEITLLGVAQICFLDEQGTGYLKDVLGKFDKRRDVPFSPVVGKLLEYWLFQRNHQGLELEDNGRIFLQNSGKPLTPVGVYQILRRAARRGGVKDEVWNTHSLRHNFATHFWRIHRDTKSLSMILGHSSQKVTEDIYVHPDPADLIQSHTSVFATGSVDLPTLNLPKVRKTPTKFILSLAIQETPSWRALGKQFEMSDVGIRKLAKRYDLLDVYYREIAQRKKFA